MMGKKYLWGKVNSATPAITSRVVAPPVERLEERTHHRAALPRRSYQIFDARPIHRIQEFHLISCLESQTLLVSFLSPVYLTPSLVNHHVAFCVETIKPVRMRLPSYLTT